MSATTSSLAAVLVAGALKEEAQASTAHRRLYLRSFLGLSPEEVFDCLLSDADHEVTLWGEDEQHQMAALVLRSTVLLPYLVTSAADSRPNAGSQGFSAFLRDHFPQAADDELRVLLILDERPLDTVITASEDAAGLVQLSWNSLCAATASLQPSTSQGSALLGSLIPDFSGHIAPGREALEALAAFATSIPASEEEAGKELHTLGIYIQDPEVGGDIAKRLRFGREWRQRLDQWSSPGQDLAKNLRKRTRNAHAVQLVLDSVRPFGIDYSQFTLGDLQSSAPAEPSFGKPFVASGPAAFLKAGDAEAAQAELPRLIAWYESDGELAIRLAGTFNQDDSGEIRWADGGITPTTIDAQAREARASFQDHSGWRFGTWMLERSGTVLDAFSLAVYTEAGTWFPVDRALLLDVDTEAFIISGDASVVAIASGGRLLTPIPIDDASRSADERIVVHVSTPDGEEHSIPLLFLGEGDDGDPGFGDTPGGGGREDLDDPDDEDDGGADDDADIGYVAKSVVHALLDFAQRSAAPMPTPQFSVTGEGAIASLGGDLYALERQSVLGLDGLQLEREILAQPEHWAFVATGRDAAAQLVPDTRLERLALGSVAEAVVQRFAETRAALFAALEPFGSAHALGAGEAHAEATAYLKAYAALLSALPEEGRYQAEFDRLIFMDAVAVPEAGEILLAPTNPVTVAFCLAFWQTAQEWTNESRGELLVEDLRSIAPTYLLPLVARDGTWHEVLTPSPFLWRRYREMRDEGAVATDDAQAIAARLKFFLEVYPAYNDHDQTVGIAVREPGDGIAIVHALRIFYRQDLSGKKAHQYSLPMLDIILVSEDASSWPRAIRSLLAGGEGTTDLDRLIRSRVRVSIRPSCDEFRHLTYVFSTPAAREPVEVDMKQRATSLFVGGLAAAPGRFFQPDSNVQSFSWGTFAMEAAGPIPGGPAADLLPALVLRLLELVGAQPNRLLHQHQTRMLSVAIERDFMPETYERSVWVVHLDHILGLEAFGPDERFHDRYLIDYQERGEAGKSGLSSVTATQRVEPYLDSLTQALSELGGVTDEGLVKLLRLLNSVSGHWALQMLRQSREQILARIGMVAAAAAAEQLDGAFLASDSGVGLLIPLEELARSLQQLGIARPESRISDDYLQLHVPFRATSDELVLRGRLLEVKYRTAGRPELAEARQEIENTRGWLEEVFNEPGPARLFRSRDLSEVIRTAFVRGSTFGLVDKLTAAQTDAFETVLGRVSSGDFAFALRFWLDGEPHIGDVISVELESDTGASRAALPGDGDAAGLIRLGRKVIVALATGQPIPFPPQAWIQPSFTPPGAGGQSTPQPAPPADGTSPPAGDVPPDPDGPVPAAPRSQQPPCTGRQDALSAQARHEHASEEVHKLARHLDTAVMKYGLELEPFQPGLAQVGPSVIRFRARPLGSQSLDGVQRRSEDIGREIGVAEGVLVGQEPYYITIDVPRVEREVVRFGDYRHLLSGAADVGALNFLVGMAASGEVVIEDIARLPHLLVAGATGAGKSVFLRCLICSLLNSRTPEDLSILLVDPKQVDFLPFEDLPHLVERRIIFDPAEAVALLSETIGAELDRRRPILKRAGVTSALEFYEAGGALSDLPQMVVIVDEFADLASTLGRGERAEFMSVIQRYGQLTRAFGIYLVLATQRPSVQVVTGDIKANLTARVALKMQASQDSITILGHGGAQSLRDKGDLLFEHGGRSMRLQGFLVTPEDLANEVGRWAPAR